MKKIFIFLILIFSIFLYFNIPPKAKKEITPEAVSTQIKTSSYVFMGDIGTGNENQAAVASSIEKTCKSKDCKGVFLMGDIFYEEGVSSVNDEQFKSKFEKPYEKINLSFYVAFGNHDYLGCTQCYVDYSPLSSKWKMPAKYYVKNFDDVDIFVINTEEFDLTQQQWLADALKQSKNKWKIVTGHRPIVTYESTHAGENWSGRDKLNEIICNNVDLYISGHSHVLEDVGKLESCKVRQLIDGGGGAYVRTILPNNKDEFGYEGYGFLLVDVNSTNLNYSFINTKNKILYKKSM